MKIRNIILTITLSFFATKIPAQTEIIHLYKGKAPGSENWDWKETLFKDEYKNDVFNVVDPTITVYPSPENNSKPIGVIICAGGGFYFQSMGLAEDVARYLNSKGITAFILKYRLIHTVTENPYSEMPQGNQDKDIFPNIKLAVDDAENAIAYVRNNAEKWDIDTDKIGIIGFSAGGTLAAATAFSQDKLKRPDFSAPIYPYIGYVMKNAVPENAPPIFIAAASNDNLGFQKGSIELYSKWNDALKSAELHIYRKGGHGFGVKNMGYPTYTFIDRFYEWLYSLYYRK